MSRGMPRGRTENTSRERAGHGGLAFTGWPAGCRPGQRRGSDGPGEPRIAWSRSGAVASRRARARHCRGARVNEATRVAQPAAGEPPGRGWQAALELGFEARAGRTALMRNRHVGPLLVQRPFYPEGPVCHVYVLHPPGGMVHGDELDLGVEATAGAQALITTPAASKIYRSAGREALARQQIRVAPGASLEWLPQESIVFDGARVTLVTRVDLAAGGRFAGWEMVCLGRPASGETFTTGRVRQRFEIWQGARPLVVERGLYDGGGAMLEAAWGLRGFPVTGTFMAAPAGPDEIAGVRDACRPGPGECFAATLMNGVLVCRYLGHEAQAGRRLFAAAWAALRPGLLGRPALAPRIWAT